MYAAQPDLSACSQEQLLQLLLLADSYGVPKVLAAAMSAFGSIPQEDLQWETVHALYALPPGCADLDACKGMFAAAGDKLQHVLGDLELVWANADKQQLLLGLPQPALLQLLKDARTRVASENTVFYTIEQWWQVGARHARSRLLELLQQVRMGVSFFCKPNGATVMICKHNLSRAL
jgi:hypothetical protein